MGNLFTKASASDLADVVVLELPDKEFKVRDRREFFKLKFPFYRMEVKAFEYKLNEICKQSNFILHDDKISTEVFTLDAFKESFCTIKTIAENWDRIERLLKSPIFREIIGS
jgi:hypothetical protein